MKLYAKSSIFAYYYAQLRNTGYEQLLISVERGEKLNIGGLSG
jgi:hypothetical protein